MSLMSLFHVRVANKRFDEETLRILETELVSTDLDSFYKSQSSLTQFLRSVSLSTIHDLADKPLDRKLLTLEFFVRAFALLGDIESCFAIKYEGFVLRELESARCGWLEVSEVEWLRFAQDLLHHGFYSIARQACENALSHLQKKILVDAQTDEFLKRSQIIAKIQRLKEHALKAAASGSVQAQGVEHLKKKAVEKIKTNTTNCEDKCVATTLYRNGIKKRNARKFRESQNVKQKFEPWVLSDFVQ